LVGDPLFLNLSDLVLHLVYLLFDVVLLSLKRTSVLVLTILLFQLIQLTIQSINSMLLLSDSDVTLLNVTFEFLNLTFLILKLVN